jgi:hypothetical protein
VSSAEKIGPHAGIPAEPCALTVSRSGPVMKDATRARGKTPPF